MYNGRETEQYPKCTLSQSLVFFFFYKPLPKDSGKKEPLFFVLGKVKDVCVMGQNP